MAVIPLHRVNVLTGLKAAKIIEDPVQYADLILKAKRPLLILGGKLLEWSLNGTPALEYGLRIAKAAKIPICATAHVKSTMLEYGMEPDSVYDVVEIVHALKDPDWMGVKKEGNHDLVIFLGVRSDLEEQCLSVLKHFAYKHLKTLTLDKYYFPNADYSLTNFRKDEQWQDFLEKLIGNLSPEPVVVEKAVKEAPAAVKPQVELVGAHSDMGPQYEGETVRKEDLWIEFGGPKVPRKFEHVRLRRPEEIEHRKVEIIGPDLHELEPGSYPMGILIDVAGKELDEDAMGIFERRIHMFTNYIHNWYHMNQRYDMWIRLNKDAASSGWETLNEFGQDLIYLYTSELPIIERIQVTLFTDPTAIDKIYPEVMKTWEARDERARGLNDEDVDTFYGCVLCQSFAPTHVSIITPNRIANCGAINWFDGRAAAKIDPDGPIFAIPKGKLIDPIRGEYEGVNKVEYERSMGAYDRVYLYSAFEHPHTSCGCFEAIVFYIPEVDAFGIVHREFKGNTVIGETFSHMAGETSGGRQVEGRLGTGLEQIRSPKFIQADGGLHRVVWMPKEIKERYRQVIEAKGLYDKIATEEDVSNTDELLTWLDEHQHPWLLGEVELPT